MHPQYAELLQPLIGRGQITEAQPGFKTQGPKAVDATRILSREVEPGVSAPCSAHRQQLRRLPLLPLLHRTRRRAEAAYPRLGPRFGSLSSDTFTIDPHLLFTLGNQSSLESP